MSIGMWMDQIGSTHCSPTSCSTLVVSPKLGSYSLINSVPVTFLHPTRTFPIMGLHFNRNQRSLGDWRVGTTCWRDVLLLQEGNRKLGNQRRDR